MAHGKRFKLKKCCSGYGYSLSIRLYRQGSRVDVTVSALSDSASLLGGTLLVTPFLGADGRSS